MSYENFKQIKNREEFFNTWDSDIEKLTEAIKETVYKKYLIKCAVFQRDNFECQNELCKTSKSDLTLHHVKWQKNRGKDR